jgi:hypothetical protein
VATELRPLRAFSIDKARNLFKSAGIAWQQARSQRAEPPSSSVRLFFSALKLKGSTVTESKTIMLARHAMRYDGSAVQR